MRRPKRTTKYRLKQVFVTILSLPFIVILFGSSYAFMTMGTKTLDDSYQMSGIISSINDSKFLEINLNNSDRTFTIYRSGLDYSDILEKLKRGDTVTIYTSKRGYTELIQLEKEGTIIYAADEFKTKYILVSILCFAGGLFFIYTVIKYWRN